jgi:uncharacterized membrane protein YfcA
MTGEPELAMIDNAATEMAAAAILPPPVAVTTRLAALLTSGRGALPLNQWRLAAIGALLLASYAALLAAMGLAGSIAPMIAIAGSAGVGSVAGFAFSAVSQAALAPVMNDPVRLVQILMVCSITTQSFAIVSLWRHMDWRRLPFHLAGGALGLPVGVYLLLHLGLVGFHAAIGALLLVYGSYVLLRRPFVLSWGGWPAEMAVGFLGGITGGLAAFPSTAITVWCSMKGWDKARQRGVYQPFILAMQFMALATIALMRTHTGSATMGAYAMLSDAIVFVPGTLLGSWFGLHIFKKISDQSFRRCLGALLALSGVLMIV